MDPSASSTKREVSESSFEYFLGEILSLSYPMPSNDPVGEETRRLENIGYEVGYRYVRLLTENFTNLFFIIFLR